MVRDDRLNCCQCLHTVSRFPWKEHRRKLERPKPLFSIDENVTKKFKTTIHGE